MRKRIAVVGLAALMTLATGTQAFAQPQTEGASQASTAQQAGQNRNDNNFSWDWLGLLGLAGLAGLMPRKHEERRGDRMRTG